MKSQGHSGRLLYCAICILAFASLLLNGCWMKDVETPHYTQTTNYYCGAASAQMILNSQNLGIYVPSQDVLYDYIHSHNQCSGWYSGPSGLRDVLNQYADTRARFAVSSLPNQNDAIKKLAYTINKHGVPPASLIYGFAHWVVVRGVMTDVDPAAASSYTVMGFFVNDPWYGESSLGENKFIGIDQWKSDYFTGGNLCNTDNNRDYVSITDPDPVPMVSIRFPKILPNKRTMLSPNDAVVKAKSAMQQFERQPEFRKQLADSYSAMKTSQMGTPVVVRRSDKQKDAYYIVPLQRGTLTSGALLINAYSGQFLEATYVKKPVEYASKLEGSKAPALFTKSLPNLKVRPEIQKQLNVEKINSLKSAPGVKTSGTKTFRQLNIQPADVKITKMELVWEPSAESQNPYYPLWKASGSVKQGSEQILGYMNLKGKVMPEITKAVKAKMKGGGIR